MIKLNKKYRLYNVYIVYDLLVSNIEKAICWIKTVTACEKSATKEGAVLMKKKWIILSVIGVLITAVVAGIVISNAQHAELIKGRRTYSSESEMRTALQGTWSGYYNANIGVDTNTLRILGQTDYVNEQLIIKGDSLTERGYSTQYWNENGPVDKGTYTIKWYPKDGYFTYYDYEVIVRSNGELYSPTLKHGHVHSRVYKKGGYFPVSNPDEKAYDALVFTVTSVQHNSSYTVCEGTVENKGAKTYKNIKIKGSFMNSSGSVLDTDWTYAVGSEGLASGEMKTFRLSVKKNTSITKCNISIMDR